MISAKRVRIARWANALGGEACWEKTSAVIEQLFGDSKIVEYIVLWAVGEYHGNFSEKSDEELGAMITLQFGFAADEKIDPSRVIKSPVQLVVGEEYRLASNGYVLGKYTSSLMISSHPCARCGCDGTHRLWSFDNGTPHGNTQGSEIWGLGIYR